MKTPKVKIPSPNTWPIPGIRPGWGQLNRWGKIRRVVYWLSMLGNVGLIVSAETSGSDQHLQADGTKRKKSDEPQIAPAKPQKDQAGEDPADEKRNEPEQQEGTAADASASA